MVETTIDLSELARHNYVIKPEFDTKLKELQLALDRVRESFDEIHAKVARDLDMETDGKVLHFELHTTYGYSFRLTRKVSLPLLVPLLLHAASVADTSRADTILGFA